MSNKVEVQTRQIRLTERIEEYVAKKAGNLDHYLPAIDEARVELAHYKAARDANDRNVAQITVFGKGFTLRSEERSDEALAAFDKALDNMQRQIERYKGKKYHGRGDGRSASDVVDDVIDEETGELSPLFAKRKKFVLYPMTEDEALVQMRNLGHDNFFVFYNAETSKVNVLYRRRNGSYGLIEPELG
ncbi:MAG TPA: ribosome-associated translation inhibitor RaiA [Anaerolineales bacterium]|nr:ribosome-associated translation inhibitor RaiA [Anaerolineales bacterium]HNA88201.1 ribosome-associated translation inhibitor RaiA [Anaerolineales bacterium]HNB34843.1 ribosome-associated translation inhibitor RaiA [Anaerolineales bacterium]HNC07283.1 ribosome-associated translation inhibitor RaiA [Anaerolineales bacterium]